MRGSTVGVRVQIYESEYRAIVAEARRLPQTETGGDLYGTFTHGNMPVIWLASGPGPRVRHEQAHFEQDSAFTTHWERHLMQEFGIQYIGSWHSHHFLSIQQPSSGDVRSAQTYARQHNRQTTLEIIVNHERSSSRREGYDFITELRPYFYPKAQDAQVVGCVRANLAILSGESPIRQQLGNHNLASFNLISWRKATGFRLPTVQSSQVPRSTTLAEEVEVEIPWDLAREVENIADLIDDEFDIQQDSSTYMVIVSLTRGPTLAIAVSKSTDLKIAQVNLIDRARGINENITGQLSSRMRLSVRNNEGIFRQIMQGAILATNPPPDPPPSRSDLVKLERELLETQKQLQEQRTKVLEVEGLLVATQQKLEAERVHVRQLEGELIAVQRLATPQPDMQRQLEDQLREAQQQLKGARGREEVLLRDQQALQEQLHETQDRFEQQLNETRRKLEAERTRVEQLQSQLQTVQQLPVQEQLQAQRHLQEQLNAAQMRENQLHEVQQNLQKKQQLYEDELRQAKDQLDQQRMIEEQLRQFKDQLEQQLREAQEELAEKLNEAKRQLNESQRNDERLLEVKNQFEAQREVVQRLEEELRTAKQQLEAYQKRKSGIFAKIREFFSPKS